MNLESIKEKLLFQMTGSEFIFLQENINNSTPSIEDEVPDTADKYAYGIRGISKTFGCSISSANRIKKSGVIKDAIIQNGRKIIVNAEEALILMKNHQLKLKK
tara:strand:- start:14119 stop:14427 length:309 start_codon:yes stop_codon:yes gene_type:complete